MEKVDVIGYWFDEAPMTEDEWAAIKSYFISKHNLQHNEEAPTLNI